MSQLRKRDEGGECDHRLRSTLVVPEKRMIARAKQLRDMASECRSIAGIMKDHRRNLLEVADQLERLAWHYESIEKNTRSLKGSC